MNEYIGRFAPSPSGPLHMGSLAAALASYLQAKKNNGRWLVRIEDIDPPREPSGAAESILQCLTTHGLLADGPISYQSEHSSRYDAALERLRESERLFACNCTRAQLKAASQQHKNSAYPGTCRESKLAENGRALRLKVATKSEHHFEDLVLGKQSEDLKQSCGDFVLRRRDGLYAYQLAVVVDDAQQGISEIVRGIDLLDNTARQIHLQQALGYAQPNYLHIPILLDENGLKLSKQNHAPALDLNKPLENLQTAWRALNQAEISPSNDCTQFLLQAQDSWNPSQLRYSLSK